MSRCLRCWPNSCVLTRGECLGTQSGVNSWLADVGLECTSRKDVAAAAAALAPEKDLSMVRSARVVFMGVFSVWGVKCSKIRVD